MTAIIDLQNFSIKYIHINPFIPYTKVKFWWDSVLNSRIIGRIRINFLRRLVTFMDPKILTLSCLPSVWKYTNPKNGMVEVERSIKAVWNKISSQNGSAFWLIIWEILSQWTSIRSKNFIGIPIDLGKSKRTSNQIFQLFQSDTSAHGIGFYAPTISNLVFEKQRSVVRDYMSIKFLKVKNFLSINRFF